MNIIDIIRTKCRCDKFAILSLKIYTIERHYKAVQYNMILHTSLQCLVQSINHSLSAMMTSANGNIFHVTGHLCGEFTGPRVLFKGMWKLLKFNNKTILTKPFKEGLNEHLHYFINTHFQLISVLTVTKTTETQMTLFWRYFSSLAAPEVVKITFDAASDENVINITFPFQRKLSTMNSQRPLICPYFRRCIVDHTITVT